MAVGVFYSIAAASKALELSVMKTMLLLLFMCVGALLGGCSTNQGGSEDANYSQTGSSHESEPTRVDPSIPEADGEGGSQIPPP